MLAYFWVAIGGALGSVGRFWCNDLAAKKFGDTFPWGTLLVNVAGSLVIGFLGAFTVSSGKLTPQSRAFATQFLMIGVCGGYTTFSTFSWQTLQQLHNRQWLYAGGNIFLSVALCLIAAGAGYGLGWWINSMKGS